MGGDAPSEAPDLERAQEATSREGKALPISDRRSSIFSRARPDLPERVPGLFVPEARSVEIGSDEGLGGRSLGLHRV